MSDFTVEFTYEHNPQTGKGKVSYHAEFSSDLGVIVGNTNWGGCLYGVEYSDIQREVRDNLHQLTGVDFATYTATWKDSDE